MEAYISGLETYAADASADLSRVASVGSFFVSRVDTEVDRRLEAIGTDEALALRGKAAVAQAQLAYKQFAEAFRGARWDALAARGARVQRPLWASTGTKNKAYSDVLYVEQLIGPDTVNTLTEATIEAFEDHGQVRRTVDADIEGAERAELATVASTWTMSAPRLSEASTPSPRADELIEALQAKVDVLELTFQSTFNRTWWYPARRRLTSVAQAGARRPRPA
jgi:transaldolase